MRDELKIYYEILNIYRKLITARSSDEITKLYIEYLKLNVKFDTNSPTYEGDLNNYKYGNCYCYALGLKYPSLFYKLYKKIEMHDFGHNIGFISNYSYTLKTSELLEYLYSDLDILQIKAYDSTIRKAPMHGGYKISLFIAENYDFHFYRQNTDGTWSDKRGYSDRICISNFPRPLNPRYEYIKTIEIVKPTIKSLKP